jgi:hypothetical protein
VAAVGPQERSILCVPGKGVKKNLYAPCTGSFVLELTKLKPPRKVAIVATVAEVNVTTEFPRKDGGVCKRALAVVKSPITRQIIDVIDGEGIGLAVKSHAADRPPSAIGCRANPADAGKDSKVIVHERSERGAVAINSKEFLSHCADVTVRVLK